MSATEDRARPVPHAAEPPAPPDDASAPNTLAGVPSPDEAGQEPVLRLLELLGRRWALRVLWELGDGPLGFRELQARGGGISASVLSRRLAELVEAGVLEQDPRRRYAISPEGRALAHILEQLEGWATRRP